jgi:hypothetical protein
MESQLFLWPPSPRWMKFMSDPRRTALAAIVIEPSPEPKSFPGSSSGAAAWRIAK